MTKRMNPKRTTSPKPPNREPCLVLGLSNRQLAPRRECQIRSMSVVRLAEFKIAVKTLRFEPRQDARSACASTGHLLNRCSAAIRSPGLRCWWFVHNEGRSANCRAVRNCLQYSCKVTPDCSGASEPVFVGTAQELWLIIDVSSLDLLSMQQLGCGVRSTLFSITGSLHPWSATPCEWSPAF